MKKLLTILASSTLLFSIGAAGVAFTNNSNVNRILNSKQTANEQKDLDNLINPMLGTIPNTSVETILSHLKNKKGEPLNIDASQITFLNINSKQAIIAARVSSTEYTGHIQVNYQIPEESKDISNIILEEDEPNLFFGKLDTKDSTIQQSLTKEFFKDYKDKLQKLGNKESDFVNHIKIKLINIEHEEKSNISDGTAVIEVVNSPDYNGAAVVNFQTKIKEEQKYEMSKCTQIGWTVNEYGQTIVQQFKDSTTEVPTDLPKNITSLENAFKGVKDTTITNLDKWDTSKVKNMSRMFYGAKKFDGEISNWNTSNVTNMSYMFLDAHHFNKNISQWNVEKVTNWKDFGWGGSLSKLWQIPEKFRTFQ